MSLQWLEAQTPKLISALCSDLIPTRVTTITITTIPPRHHLPDPEVACVAAD